jgi:hypothetical protein
MWKIRQRLGVAVNGDCRYIDENSYINEEFRHDCLSLDRSGYLSIFKAGNMAGDRFLIISGHDFRTRRKASVHFIAQSLLQHGEVSFYSVGFSHVSRAKMDPRVDLWSLANTVCEVDGVR